MCYYDLMGKKTVHKMKIRKITEEQHEIQLPGEIVVVGPGTVPTSTASVSETSIKEISSGFRRASKLGIFDSANPS